MTKIMIANNAEALTSIKPTHTVEAEFGADVVEGSVMTLAHHGPRAGNPCPCSAPNNDNIEIGAVIGVSHIDLDTLGGVMAILGTKTEAPAFWEAAAEIDVRGVHKLSEITTDQGVIDALNAFWAFSAETRVFPPRDGSVADVTSEVCKVIGVLKSILEGDEDRLEAGRQWAAKAADLEESSFVKEEGGVILRSAASFVNHLYRPSAEVVVAFNATYKSVTISVANPAGFSCGDAVQEMWGPEAGGHAGIAGSPRGREMTLEDAEHAWGVIRKLLVLLKK